MPRWTERLPTALHNVHALRGWGLRELDNLTLLLHLGRSAGLGMTQPAFLRKLLDTLTRLPFEYHAFPEAAAPTANGATWEPPPCDPFHADEPSIALFVDSPEHVSGVSTTLLHWKQESVRQGLSLSVLSCGATRPPAGFLHAPAIGRLALPCYAGMDLPMPRVREVLRFLDRHAFDAYHVSTPGPMGLLGLLHGRSAGIPVCGTYHTDFPAYAAQLTRDPVLREHAWSLMRTFYGAMDVITTPSEATRQELASQGLPEDRLVVVGRGVSTSRFHPALRTTRWHDEWKSAGKTHLLYVGRVSREKNLAVLSESFRQLCASRTDVVLVVVGDGPYREEMERDLQGCPVVFTGTRRGEELASLYASCDLFLFPSETDTFGVVLIEAQASGLPVLVAARGGPRHTMLPGHTGLVVDPMRPESLAAAVRELLDDPARRATMALRAREHAQTMTQEASFNAFWAAHKRCLPDAGPCRARRERHASLTP